jgi:hypothetical protein
MPKKGHTSEQIINKLREAGCMSRSELTGIMTIPDPWWPSSARQRGRIDIHR